MGSSFKERRERDRSAMELLKRMLGADWAARAEVERDYQQRIGAWVATDAELVEVLRREGSGAFMRHICESEPSVRYYLEVVGVSESVLRVMVEFEPEGAWWRIGLGPFGSTEVGLLMESMAHVRQWGTGLQLELQGGYVRL